MTNNTTPVKMTLTRMKESGELDGFRRAGTMVGYGIINNYLRTKSACRSCGSTDVAFHPYADEMVYRTLLILECRDCLAAESV